MDYKLSELFDLQMGKTPSRDNPAYWDSPQYAWISIADLTSAGKYITDTKESLSALAVEESGIKVIDRFAGRIVGGWSDLELVNRVIRHNSSSKAYFDFNKSVYYFVEYDKSGERIRGITDKKSIVSALFDDMTVTVDSISVMTDDKSIYVHIMHDLTGNRLYGCFSYANTFDMTWIKWFRRICYGECRG